MNFEDTLYVCWECDVAYLISIRNLSTKKDVISFIKWVNKFI